MTPRYKVEPKIQRRSKVVTAGEGDEWVEIGRLAEVGPTRNVRLGLSGEHVLAIVGKRGAGKSFTLGSVLEGLCTASSTTPINRIDHTRAVLLFDTLNIFQWMGRSVASSSSSSQVQQQSAALRSWGLDPVELNIDLWVPAGFESRMTNEARPFRIRTWDMAAGDWAALIGVDAVRDPMGQLLSLVVDKVTSRGWTRADGSTLAPMEVYKIENLLDCLAEDGEVAHDYAVQTVRAVRQRLGAYASSPLFGDTGTPLRELLQPGRLSVVLLSGIPDDVRLAMIYLTIRKLLQARADASEAQKSLQLGAVEPAEQARVEALIEAAPPKSWVVLDEAQNVFPSEKQTSASNTLLRFVREGRNFGLSLAFTTQQPTALDPRILAQVDTVLSHTLTVASDLKAVTGNLKSDPPSSISRRGRNLKLTEAIRGLGVGQVFVSAVDVERGFFMDVRPRVSVHGGFEA